SPWQQARGDREEHARIGPLDLEAGAFERHRQGYAEIDPPAPAPAHAPTGAEHPARIGREVAVGPGPAGIEEHERLQRKRVGAAREHAAVTQLERGTDRMVSHRHAGIEAASDRVVAEARLL